MMNEEIMDLLVAYWNGELDEVELDEKFGDPTLSPHGKIVDMIETAYGDWYTYEDGHMDFFNIGD